MHTRWLGKAYVPESLVFRHKPWITVFLKDKKGTNLCVLNAPQSQEHLVCIKMPQLCPIGIADATQLELQSFPSLLRSQLSWKLDFLARAWLLQVKIPLSTQEMARVFLFFCKMCSCTNEEESESSILKWWKEKRRGSVSWLFLEKAVLGVLQLPRMQTITETAYLYRSGLFLVPYFKAIVCYNCLKISVNREGNN